MSSIPLPALAVQPPQQQASPLDQYQKLLSLKALMQQRQIQQQLAPAQIQEAQQRAQATSLQNQLTQQQMNDSKIYMQSLQKHEGDFDAALEDAAKNGMSGQGYLQMGQMILQRKAAVLKMTGDQLDNAGKIGNQLAGQLDGFKKLSPQDQQAQWPTIRQQVAQTAPNLANALPQQPPTSDQLDAFEASLMGEKNLIDKATAESRAASAKVSAERLQQELPGGSLYAPTVAAATAKATMPIKVQEAAATEAARAPIQLQVEAAKIPLQVQGEIAKAQALAPTLDEATKTTASGTKYLDLTNIKGPQAALLTQQALKAGVPVADEKTSTALSAIDTARQNQQFMLDQISSKLASGAPTRLWYGPLNTIEKIAQTDPTLAAIGDYRSAAIQSMRAVAGSGGLRINQAEIKQATDNDIPKMTDTLPVAQQKLKNMQAFLDHTENGLLQKNRAPSGGGMVTMKAPNGQTKQVPADQVEHYKSLGATIAQ